LRLPLHRRLSFPKKRRKKGKKEKRKERTLVRSINLAEPSLGLARFDPVVIVPIFLSIQRGALVG